MDINKAFIGINEPFMAIIETKLERETAEFGRKIWFPRELAVLIDGWNLGRSRDQFSSFASIVISALRTFETGQPALALAAMIKIRGLGFFIL